MNMSRIGHRLLGLAVAGMALAGLTLGSLGPAFAGYLREFEGCFVQERTREHLHTYCRGLLSDLPRKSAEPMALAFGQADDEGISQNQVLALQRFLTYSPWSAQDVQREVQTVFAQRLVPSMLVAYVRAFAPKAAIAVKAEAAGDLDKRMRELQEQLDALKKQTKDGKQSAKP